MQGDFARVTFDKMAHFTRVLQNQGRVQVEADWNEQGAIILHLLRSVIIDLAGPAWRAGTGFALTWDKTQNDVRIRPGHYYVDGFLCENDSDADVFLSKQPWGPRPDGDPEPTLDKRGFFYIDAWERHVTSNEVRRLRETALGAVETTSRAQLVWQIRFLDLTAIAARLNLIDAALAIQLHVAERGKDDAAVVAITAKREAVAVLGRQTQNAITCDSGDKVLQATVGTNGQLRAKLKPGGAQTDPCTLSPEAAFRGSENQLYRVEVHDPGLGGTATFKWSRENGSVTMPVRDISSDGKSQVVHLTDLGRDARLGLCAGDLVEYVDDDVVLARRASPLARVLMVDRAEMTVTLDAKFNFDATKHPMLRRWDQTRDATAAGVIKIVEADDDTNWVEVEDGILVQFQPGGLYVTGDYWQIPGRVATGIEWPVDKTSRPIARRPDGVEHHTAALGFLMKSGGKPPITPCGCTLPGLCRPATP